MLACLRATRSESAGTGTTPPALIRAPRSRVARDRPPNPRPSVHSPAFGAYEEMAQSRLSLVASRSPTATTCRLTYRSTPRPGGLRQCSTCQRLVSCTRPPGSGTVSRAAAHDKPGDVGGHPAAMAGGRRSRSSSPITSAPGCVGDVFLKIDADQTRTDAEVEAMLWRRSRLRISRGEAARARARRPPRTALGLRRAVDRVVGAAVGAAPDAARRAAAAMARSKP